MQNKIVVEGRLGKDAELVDFNDRKLVRFDIAHTEDSVTWIPVRVFGKLVETASQLTKGTMIKVTGALRQRNYKTKDGANRRTMTPKLIRGKEVINLF